MVNSHKKIVTDIMEKKKYIAPRIEIIFLDNEISLALQSTPPDGPGEAASLTPEYRNYDPFKPNLS